MNSIGNVGKKTLISLTIPIFLELLLVTIVGNIDTIMLGYYSDEAVGAIGGITQLLNIQNVIFSFINMATAILTAQFLGAKDYKRVKQVISVSLVLNILLGVVLGGIYLFFCCKITCFKNRYVYSSPQSSFLNFTLFTSSEKIHS